MVEANSHFTLNNGQKMPALTFGTYTESDEVNENALIYAIDAGYRSIDTADFYGNEHQLGRSLKKVLDEGKVKREELFITTKVWNSNHHKEGVRASVEGSLKKLNLDYADMVLIHFPFAGLTDVAAGKTELQYVPLSETWAAMEQLVEDGLARGIGISNFNVQLTLDLLSYAKIKPAIAQTELHPYNPQHELVAWLQSQGIRPEGFSPLYLSTLVGEVQLKKLVEREEILEIANRLGKSAVQVLLSWGISRGTVVVARSTNKGRIEQNLEAIKFKLSQEDIDKINAITDRSQVYDYHKLFGVPLFA